MQQYIKMLLFLILNEAQHVSGDTQPIIRSLILHNQTLVLHTWKVVGSVALGLLSGRVYTLPDKVQQRYVQQSSKYTKSEVTGEFLAPDVGRCVARNMFSFI
jgi:hypothetical protein